MPRPGTARPDETGFPAFRDPPPAGRAAGFAALRPAPGWRSRRTRNRGDFHELRQAGGIEASARQIDSPAANVRRLTTRLSRQTQRASTGFGHSTGLVQLWV